MFFKRTAAIAMLTAFAVTLGACGRKNAPEYPEGSTHPKNYPAPYGAEKDKDK